MTAPTTGEREPDEISAALNDLEHAVKCEYAFPNVHQAMHRKFDRDMSVVTDARNAYDALRADLARVTALLATAQREAAGLRDLETWMRDRPDKHLRDGWIMFRDSSQQFVARCYTHDDIEAPTLAELVAKLTPAPEAGR